MPDANAINYLALQDAVLGRRFPASSQRENSKRWLATAYSDVWSALRQDNSLWDFEVETLSDFAVTAGDSTPTMPADYADTLTLYDAQGVLLERLPPDELERLTVTTTGPGNPYWYMVSARQLYLFPTPSGDATLKHTYRRRLAHKQANQTTIVAGFMDENDDYPLWEDHHSILIPRAYAIGLIELNDPTWEQAQEEYERQLDRMKEDYERIRPQTQWGAVNWAGTCLP